MNIFKSVFRSIFAILLPGALAGTAAAGELSYMTLNGVHQVAVEIEGIRDDFSRYGLESRVILERTTTMLREHGIKVVDTGAMRHDPDTALLRIDLNANENQYRFFFYGLSVELVQKMPLNNSAGGYTSEIVWQEGQTGVVMPTEMRKLNIIVSELLAKFLDDYHAQNPEGLSAVDQKQTRKYLQPLLEAVSKLFGALLSPQIGGSKAPCAGNGGSISKRGNAANADLRA